MKKHPSLVLGIGTLVVLLGVGTLLPAAARAKHKSGTSNVSVTSCENTANGVRIKRGNGSAYELKNGTRDAGHGLRTYTLTCVSATMYKVHWVNVDNPAAVRDLGLYGFVTLGKNNKEVQWSQEVVLTPADAANNSMTNPTFPLTFRVRNYGSIDVGKFKNTVAYDGKIIATKHTSSLNAGAIATVTVNVPLKPKPGTHTLQFRVNASPSLGEKDMSNNTGLIRVVFSGFPFPENCQNKTTDDGTVTVCEKKTVNHTTSGLHITNQNVNFNRVVLHAPNAWPKTIVIQRGGTGMFHTLNGLKHVEVRYEAYGSNDAAQLHFSTTNVPAHTHPPANNQNPSKAPVITSPTPNQVLTNFPRVATITWTGVTGAAQYEVEIACDVCVSTTEKWLNPTFHTTANTSFTTNPLAGDNEFRVRVRAYGSNGMVGPWSAYRYFRYNTAPAVSPTFQSISLSELQGKSPTTLSFEESQTGNLATKYWNFPGVSFTSTSGSVIFISKDNRGGVATASGEYSIAADAAWPGMSNNKPLVITLRNGAEAVGFFLGNGNAYGTQVTATITFYGKDGQLLGTLSRSDVGDPVTTFVGAKSNVPIYRITVDYGNTGLSEELDDFMMAPGMVMM